jgi:DNA gyrase subunit A
VQKRGGTGKTGGRLRNDDAVGLVLTAMAHDHLLIVANDGSSFTLRAFDVPQRSRTAQGLPIGELLPKLPKGVGVATILPLRTKDESRSLLLLSKAGKAKRLKLSSLKCARSAM